LCHDGDMPALALRIYGCVTWLLQPLLRIKLAQRARDERGYSEAVEERFGHYTQAPEHLAQLVWVHAVSLGETRTAALLIQALRQADPSLRFLLTNGTATGRAEGRALLGSGDVQVWQPWDTPAAVARFFTHFKPRLGLLMETEVWPCTVAGAQHAGVPLVLVNARLSEKSLRQAQHMAWLAQPAFAALAQVYAQTPDDARRLQQIGARVDGVFGNLKFDAAPSEDQQAQGRAWRQALGQPVLLFASSRDGEEAAFLKEIGATAQSNRAQPAIDSIADSTRPAGAVTRSFKPLVVPRHPQRFDDVQALAEAQGLKVSRRSSWPAAGPFESAEAMQADVWLGDSLGEMALYYALSDVALLGGSFAPLGGQNLIEAAACGCPVVMGPHTFNFSEAAELAQTEGAAVRVADMREGVRSASGLVNEPRALAKMADAGLAFAARNRGATERTLAALIGH
jgi:3-deoxy-D-manno-octulosonic-acid transferase